jgi:hypothetical protein
MYCLFCDVPCIVVCICLLKNCHRVATQLQLNIIYHIPLGLISVCKGVVHKEFIPGGKTVSAEFYKGIMDLLLKRIQRVCPPAFCSRDFFVTR